MNFIDILHKVVNSINADAGRAVLAVVGGIVGFLGYRLSRGNINNVRDDVFEAHREKVINAMAQNDRLVEQLEMRAEFAIDGLEAILRSTDFKADTSEATNALNLVKASPRMIHSLVDVSRNGRSIEDVEKMTNERDTLKSLRQMLNSENKIAGKLSDSAYDIVFNKIETMIAKFES